MLINSVPIDIVGDAYHIAANYLGKTGLMPATSEIHQPLLDAVVQEFSAGTHNKIIWQIELSRGLKKRLTRWN